MRAGRRRPSTGKAERPLVEIEIDSLGHLGDGRGALQQGRQRIEVLVDGALPGEHWLVHLTSEGRGRWRGEPVKALHVKERSPAVCPHFGACGGCRLQHLPAVAYSDLKRRRIQTALQHRGIETAELLPTISSPLASRRRLRLAFDGQGNLGLRQRRGRAVVNMQQCAIAHPDIEAALPELRYLTRTTGGVGELSVTRADRGLDIVIIGGRRPAASVTLPENSQRLGWCEEADALVEILAQRAEPSITLAGTPVALPPLAFLQATQAGEQALQAFARRELAGARRILDAFCGLGTLGLALAAEGIAVTGLELDAASIKSLRATGRLAHAEVCDLMRAPPTTKTLNRFDAVILDPPRAGAEALVQALAKSAVPQAVVASCDPRTFARDAATLLHAGYSMGPIQPIDQFLFSAEIELIASFKRG